MTRGDLREMVELVRRQNRLRLAGERATEPFHFRTGAGTDIGHRRRLGQRIEREQPQPSGRRAEPRAIIGTAKRAQVLA